MAGSERDQLVAERQLSGRSDISPQASFAWLQELSAPDGLPSDLQDHIDGLTVSNPDGDGVRLARLDLRWLHLDRSHHEAGFLLAALGAGIQWGYWRTVRRSCAVRVLAIEHIVAVVVDRVRALAGQKSLAMAVVASLEAEERGE